MEESKRKSDKKGELGVPQLVDMNSDFHGWYSRLQLKLDAKGLWEDFCAKPETVPDKDSDKDKYEKHLQRRKEARWRIEKTLSLELSNTVHDLEQPYDLLTRLRKMFVGATKLMLVHQLRSVMLMKYEKGKNLLNFIEELKDGFSKLDNMGLSIEDKLKPYVLVMVLDDAFDDILRPYLVHTLAGNVELKFVKIVELLESSYIESERRQQLSKQESQKEGETALAANGKQKRSGKCRHCGMKGHWKEDCRTFKEKEARGWKNPPPCRTRRDFHDDDRDPTRRKSTHEKKRSRDEDDDQGNSKASKKSKNGNDKKKGKSSAMLAHSDIDESSGSESALMAIAKECFETITSENEWVLDSGATRHMTYSSNCLKNYKPVSAGVEVGGKQGCW